MHSRNPAARLVIEAPGAGRLIGWMLVVLATVLGGKVGQNDVDESARATASPSAAT